MTSTLQEQLQKLATAAGIAPKKGPRGKPSLLYTFQEAADVGIEDVYSVAVHGFDQLCRVDPRFQAYRKTLFSPSTLTMDRDQQTPETNAKLDASISSFCDLLAPYFLLPATFKALEYLIRRFRVHEFNVPALMHAALPYHATNEFVRLVHILHLDPPHPFAFLQPMQKTGVALPRSLLVQRCLTDRSLLRFVCETAQALGTPAVGARAVMPFFAALLCEIVAAAPEIDEPFVAMLLPYILHGLDADTTTADHRAAIYMLLVQLATRTTFTPPLFHAILVELTKSATPAALSQVLLVLSHLTVTQGDGAIPPLPLPAPVFSHLAKLPSLPAELKVLAGKGPRTQKLLSLLTLAAAKQCSENELYGRVLVAILSGVPLSGNTAEPAADHLMIMASSPSIVGRETVIRALHMLDQRYPTVTETAVNRALGRLSDAKDTKGKELLAGILQEAFAGSLRTPLLESSSTLAVAVDAASAGIRRLALEKLDEIVANADDQDADADDNPMVSGEEKEKSTTKAAVAEADEVLRGALLRRVHDDDSDVVLTALGLNTLLKLPPLAVVDSLSGCLQAAVFAASRKETSKAQRAAGRSIARKVIKVLTGGFVDTYPEYVDKVAELVFSEVVAAPHTRSVAELAVGRGGEVRGHPLLAALKHVDVASFSGEGRGGGGGGGGGGGNEEGEANKKSAAAKRKKGKATPPIPIPTPTASKSKKHYDDDAHNKAVIHALATACYSNFDAQAALTVLLGSKEPKTRGLALIVANVAMQSNANTSAATIGVLPVSVLQNFTGGSGSGSGSGTTSATVQYDQEKGGEPSAPTLVALASGVLPPTQLEPETVLSALQFLADADLKSIGREGLETLFRRFAGLSPDVWSPHLGALVVAAQRVVPSVLDFLSDLWASPSEDPCVCCAALQLWIDALVVRDTTTTAATSKKTSKQKHESPAIDVITTLPRILACLGHPDRSVRTEAVRVCGLLSTSVPSTVWYNSNNRATDVIPPAVVASLLTALHAQGKAIEADSEGAEALLRNALNTISHHTSLATPQSPTKRGRKKVPTTSSITTTTTTTTTLLHVSFDVVTSLSTFILSTALPLQPITPAGLHAASFLLNIVHDASPPTDVLISGHALFIRLAGAPTDSTTMLRSLTTPLECRVATQIAELFNDAAFTSASTSTSTPDGIAPDVLECLFAMATSPAMPTNVRRHALSTLTPAVFKSLSVDAQRQAFMALTTAAARDRDDGCRAAASASIASAPLSAPVVIPFLSYHPSTGVDVLKSPKKQRGTKSSPTTTIAIATATTTTNISSLVATLEVLQWKEGIEDEIEMVPCLQSTLRALLHSLRLSGSGSGNGGGGEHRQEEEEEEDGQQTAARLFAIQLSLALLSSLAKTHLGTTTSDTTTKNSKAAEQFDIALAVLCAQQTLDSAVRSSALHLISILASAMPRAALSHVLPVVSVVRDTSGEALLDASSTAVAAQALHAVACAWLQREDDESNSNSIEQLVDAVVEAVCAAPPTSSRRLALLWAVVSATAGEGGDGASIARGLQWMLLALLQRQVSVHAGGRQEKGNEEEEGGGLLALANALLQYRHQVPLLVQAQSLALLLHAAMESSHNNPTAPIVLLSTAFVTKRLQEAPSLVVNTNDVGDDDVENKDASGLQTAYEEVMQTALTQIHRLGVLVHRYRSTHGMEGAETKTAATRKKKSTNTRRKEQKDDEEVAVDNTVFDAASHAAYALTEALQHVMSPESYVTALRTLISIDNRSSADDNESDEDEGEKIRRKALSLLTNVVSNRGGAKEPSPALASASLSAVPPILDCIRIHREENQKCSVLTRQVALTALGSLAKAFAAHHPQPFLTAIPVVLDVIKQEATSQPLRASGLASIAVMVTHLQGHVVPVLPPTMHAVMEAAQRAATLSSSEVDVEKEDGVTDAAALELAAALSAIAAFVSSLGPFLAPHLPSLLTSVLLNPSVLITAHRTKSTPLTHCCDLAATIRTDLARHTPSRLLLSPLAAVMDTICDGGKVTAEEEVSAAVVAVLKMLQTAVEGMDAGAIASYHESVFGQILRALDLRRVEAVGGVVSGEAQAVEDAAIAVLVALTMKMSETKFKPLFFRLVDWATTKSSPGSGSGGKSRIALSPLPRVVALLSCANALSTTLRAIFTPYFQPLLEPIIFVLTSDGGATEHPPASKKKKRQRLTPSALAAGQEQEEGGVVPPEEHAPLELLARLLAIRALHRCFLYDTSGFLDEAKFDRLLTPIISQLHYNTSSTAATAAFTMQLDQNGIKTLEASLSPEALSGLDVYSRAVVGCLVQMALAAGGGDARWRPLHHAVLMATRSPHTKTRLAALEGVAALAQALQEEYLPLLPEALPFLAELLEDEHHEVEERAAAAIRALEALSGEDLKEYLKT